MLGMMQGKGGQQTPQGMGQNQGLAALFRNNAPASPGATPGAAPGLLPQIMAPQMPNIGMPPAARLTRPQQTQKMPAAPTFNSMNELMRFQHTNPGQLSPETANMWKKSLKNPWGR